MKSAKAKSTVSTAQAMPVVLAARAKQTKKVEGAKITSATKAVPKKRTPAPATGKIGVLIKLMSAKHGASIDQLSKATGWQHHSVRGAISGTVKTKLGVDVQSARVNGVRVYRIAK